VVPTQQQVRSLVAAGLSYEEVGRRLGVSPGLAYLVGTGVPADGSDSLTPEQLESGDILPTSQQLSNPEWENPTRSERVLEWVRQRAASDAQMQHAAAQRDAEPGEPQEPEIHDIVTLIGRDHNQVNALMQQLSAIPGHKKGGSATHIERRASIVDMMTRALAEHESAEEEYFWPAVRQKVPDGDALAEQGREQEQKGNETLQSLADADPDSDEFDDLVEQLILELRKHVAFEDRVLLAFENATDERERRKLGEKFRKAKKIAPTRPHPRAPRGRAKHEAAGPEDES
jgi:hemerythrin-like domain-containing protein